MNHTPEKHLKIRMLKYHIKTSLRGCARTARPTRASARAKRPAEGRGAVFVLDFLVLFHQGKRTLSQPGLKATRESICNLITVFKFPNLLKL